jgi:hypothetical protein
MGFCTANGLNLEQSENVWKVLKQYGTVEKYINQ